MKLTLKSIFRRPVIVTLLVFVSPIAIISFLIHRENLKIINSFVGQYKLDNIQTKLGGYEKDKNIYASLELELKEDGTYKFNMAVPFILDSCGTWYLNGDGSEGSWYVMKSSKNPLRSSYYTQVSLYKDGDDTVFYMNSVTPRHDQESIQLIYFKKQ